MNGMRRERTMTAFYLETVLMAIIFVLVIVILSQVLGISKMQSRQASQLTNAVCLAQNAAEAVAASDSEQALLSLLSEEGAASLDQGKDGAVLTAYYDSKMQPLQEAEAAADEGSLRLEATWVPETSGQGTFVTSDISIYAGSGSNPVYTLNTGKYLNGQEAER